MKKIKFPLMVILEKKVVLFVIGLKGSCFGKHAKHNKHVVVCYVVCNGESLRKEIKVLGTDKETSKEVPCFKPGKLPGWLVAV